MGTAAASVIVVGMFVVSGCRKKNEVLNERTWESLPTAERPIGDYRDEHWRSGLIFGGPDGRQRTKLEAPWYGISPDFHTAAAVNHDVGTGALWITFYTESGLPSGNQMLTSIPPDQWYGSGRIFSVCVANRPEALVHISEYLNDDVAPIEPAPPVENLYHVSVQGQVSSFEVKGFGGASFVDGGGFAVLTSETGANDAMATFRVSRYDTTAKVGWEKTFKATYARVMSGEKDFVVRVRVSESELGNGELEFKDDGSFVFRAFSQGEK